MSKQQAVAPNHHHFRDFVENALAGMVQKRHERETQAREFENLLPEDLTGQILINSKKQARQIKARMDTIDSELSRIEAEMRAARREQKAKYLPIYAPEKAKGDILFDNFTIEPAAPRPGMAVKSKEAVGVYRAKIQNLEVYKRRLMAEQQGRYRELADLRKIVSLAGSGNVAVLNFLVGRWSSVFQFGAGLLAQLPAGARMSKRIEFCDQFGNPLPPEAMNMLTGEPDLPGRGFEMYREEVLG